MTARRISLMVLLPLCLAVFAAGVWAQQERPWIHIHVSDGDDDGKEIRVNLPFGLAHVALGVISDEIVKEGRLELKNHDISVEELRQMWLELKNSGDAEFVSVEDGDKSVRVAREGARLLVDVDGHGDKDGSKSVRIDVPVTLVDALFAGEGATLDLQGALAELRDERGDIIAVEDGEKQVRIWIDNTKS